MKKVIVCLVFVAILCFSCDKQEENPFFSEYDTPFSTPPFDKIKEEHYVPAFKAGMKQQQEEISAIVNNSESPTFKNTIETLERSGSLLNKVNYVFYNLKEANTNDKINEIAKEMAPLLSKHNDDINLNEKLFQKVKSVYDQKDNEDLSQEQEMLLDKMYKEFVRGGANLDAEEKEKLRKINEELSLLFLKFGDNILEENNRFELVIDNKEDLAGLNETIIAGAAEAAKERGHEGKWVFTIHKPSLIPFLQYSEKRELREKMFKAYINKGNNNDDLDNKETISKIVSLRLKKANLLGYKTHSDFILEETMAKHSGNVYNLLNQLWKPALQRAKNEAKDLQAMIDKEGENFKLEPWDWWRYAEKVKKEKYDLDEEMLRPYFKLENVLEGLFTVVNKLYGIQFIERNDIPKYHEDVKVFELKEADGTHIGILYADYFPRASKEGGAWMNPYRKEYKVNGKRISPVVCNVGNLSKPTADKPSLLSVDEVSTIYHEFGHAIHGLLANTIYEKLSGTAVAGDFVELPSQIMENWAFEPEVLKMYARHYKTGEVIPQELIEKLKKSKLFNQGFETVEYLAACFLDMDWHTLTETGNIDVLEFEKRSLDKIGLIPEIVVRYRSPYFAHIFSSDYYSSGYYFYIWAEVIDADAFQAFKEAGIFDKETAAAFRKNILEMGGTEDPMVLYKQFRGSEPKIDALLERRGLNYSNLQK